MNQVDTALHRARVNLHEIEGYLDAQEGLPEDTEFRLGNINGVADDLAMILTKTKYTIPKNEVKGIFR